MQYAGRNNMVYKNIQITRADLRDKLEAARIKIQTDIDRTGIKTTITYMDVIDSLLSTGTITPIEVIINPEGRFEGSRALAGKTIFYQVK